MSLIWRVILFIVGTVLTLAAVWFGFSWFAMQEEIEHEKKSRRIESDVDDPA
jgi:hypothetical protein